MDETELLNASDEQVEQALIKRALGYEADEVIEEYAVVDGEQTLVKRKVTSKSVSPDLSAIKYLKENDAARFSAMTDSQLRAQKRRLLAELSACGKTKKGESADKPIKSAVKKGVTKKSATKMGADKSKKSAVKKD